MVPLDFDSVKADIILFFNVFFVDVDIIKNKLNQAMITAIYNKRKKHKAMRIPKKKNVENSKFHLIVIYIKN